MLCFSLATSLASTLLVWPLVDAAVIDARQEITRCKVLPSDSQWPSQDTWDQLNQTVGGRLIATIPQAAICHPEGYGLLRYDETACDALAQEWDHPRTYMNIPGEIMNPYYQNASCSPFYRTNETCKLGNYVSYAISVSGAPEVAAGIKFAQDNNVRLVIKNTGHDFLGKSTGKGGLSLWTHNLKSSEIITTYNGSSDYIGPAIKLGAGMTGGEALMVASSAGYRLVTGDCPTVGIAGGYSAGGGHGLLNGVYGMAADNVLEWEVVTADGQHVKATPAENQDLYWALSGGGAGTFAVVLSMTTKIYPDLGPIGAASLSFSVSSAPSNESYAAAVQAWWQFLPTVVDTGATPQFNFESGVFHLYNTTAPNKTANEMAAMFEPYLIQLRDLSIHYDFASFTAPTYFEHYNTVNGPLPDGPYAASQLFNSRLIPRAISENAYRAEDLTAAMEMAMASDLEASWSFGCMGLNVKNIQHPNNAVVPYWRNAVAICLNFSLYNWTIPESKMLARKAHMADVITPMIEAATPESGAYLNEADPYVYPPENSDKWQNTFYGTNYPRLRQIKDKWDPKSVFYAYTAVGSEGWTEDSEGRLCKA